MRSYDSAFIGTSLALASFKREFGLATKTPEQFASISSNIVSTYQAGCFFGSLFGYPLGTLLGRKRGLLISSLVFLLGAGIVSPDGLPSSRYSLRSLRRPMCTDAGR